MTRNCFTNLLIAIMSALSAWSAVEPASSSMAAADGLTGACPSSRESVDRYYTLTARVRLLVFWIDRPGVGAGRITWGESDDGTRGLALLIGSDPARAPMKINRWGYIIERVKASRADLVGVMTEAEEQSIEQARRSIDSAKAVHSFKGIRSWIQDGTAQSNVSYMKFTEDFTYREADFLLQRIPQEAARVRRLCVPDGTEPGFLFAVGSLVRDSAEAYRRSGVSGVAKDALRRYVFSGSVFELRRRSTREVPEIVINGCTFRRLLESTFEARNLSNGGLSNFSITYGVRDPIDGIPVRIAYRPRWWFEAEMLLDNDAAASQSVRGEGSWRFGAN